MAISTAIERCSIKMKYLRASLRTQRMGSPLIPFDLIWLVAYRCALRRSFSLRVSAGYSGARALRSRLGLAGYPRSYYSLGIASPYHPADPHVLFLLGLTEIRLWEIYRSHGLQAEFHELSLSGQ